MPILLWNDKLALGHGEIDGQHMLLVEMINDLYDQIQGGKARSGVPDAIQGLKAYAGYHFAEEERLMLRHGYPDLEDHRLAHLDFAERVEAFAAASTTDTRDTALEVLAFLTEWLGHHIQQSDRKFLDFLKLSGS